MSITGIICPCRQELEPFFKAADNITAVQIKRQQFFKADIAGREVLLCNSGIGKVNSALAAQLMIDRFDVDRIIVSGTAGGIDQSIELFDTVICETAVYHDFAAGYLKAEYPNMDEAVFKADAGITKCLPEGRYIYGCIVSGDKFVEDKDREQLIEKFNAVCADMETAAVAHCCYINEVPFAAVRTITDTPKYSGISNCLANLDKAAAISASVVIEILKNS